jgi:hypothetical protein
LKLSSKLKSYSRNLTISSAEWCSTKNANSTTQYPIQTTCKTLPQSLKSIPRENWKSWPTSTASMPRKPWQESQLPANHSAFAQSQLLQLSPRILKASSYPNSNSKAKTRSQQHQSRMKAFQRSKSLRRFSRPLPTRSLKASPPKWCHRNRRECVGRSSLPDGSRKVLLSMM